MPTLKPRVTITLQPHVYETYRVFSEAQGKRVSNVLSEMLTECEPSIRKTVALLIAAQDAPKEVMDSLRQTFEGFANQVDEASGGAQKALDLALKKGA